jgi:hypothetical protein
MSFTSCAHCLHCSIDLQGDQATGGMICRRYPPIAVPVTVPTATGVSVQIHSVFPPVKEASRCGEFEAAPKAERKDN